MWDENCNFLPRSRRDMHSLLASDRNQSDVISLRDCTSGTSTNHNAGDRIVRDTPSIQVRKGGWAVRHHQEKLSLGVLLHLL